MPPSPRNSPALEVALSRDTTRRDTGWHRDESKTGWEFLFGDGQWRPVDVRAWWTEDGWRDVVQIYWTAEHSTWSGSFLFDPEKMREGLGGGHSPGGVVVVDRQDRGVPGHRTAGGRIRDCSGHTITSLSSPPAFWGDPGDGHGAQRRDPPRSAAIRTTSELGNRTRGAIFSENRAS